MSLTSSSPSSSVHTFSSTPYFEYEYQDVVHDSNLSYGTLNQEDRTINQEEKNTNKICTCTAIFNSSLAVLNIAAIVSSVFFGMQKNYNAVFGISLSAGIVDGLVICWKCASNCAKEEAASTD